MGTNSTPLGRAPTGAGAQSYAHETLAATLRTDDAIANAGAYLDARGATAPAWLYEAPRLAHAGTGWPLVVLARGSSTGDAAVQATRTAKVASVNFMA
jgi:hypothetical protein